MYYGGWKNAKAKKWGLLGSQEEPSDHLHLIYSHRLPTLIFLIQERTACHVIGH